MIIRRGVIYILFFLAILFISGCINIDIKQKIDSDGSSHMTVKYDMSAMMSLAESMGGQTDANNQSKHSELDESCKKFLANTTWINAECNIDGYKIMMSGDVPTDSNAFTKRVSIPYIKYTYNINKIYQTAPEVNGLGNATKINSEELKKSKDMISNSGIKMTYTVEMPGKIVKTDVGEIKDNKAVINLLDISDNKEIYVESEEINYLWDGIVIAVIVIIIILIFVFKKKKVEPQSPQNNNQPYQIIQQYPPSTQYQQRMQPYPPNMQNANQQNQPYPPQNPTQQQSNQIRRPPQTP